MVVRAVSLAHAFSSRSAFTVRRADPSQPNLHTAVGPTLTCCDTGNHTSPPRAYTRGTRYSFVSHSRLRAPPFVPPAACWSADSLISVRLCPVDVAPPPHCGLTHHHSSIHVPAADKPATPNTVQLDRTSHFAPPTHSVTPTPTPTLPPPPSCLRRRSASMMESSCSASSWRPTRVRHGGRAQAGTAAASEDTNAMDEIALTRPPSPRASSHHTSSLTGITF